MLFVQNSLHTLRGSQKELRLAAEAFCADQEQPLLAKSFSSQQSQRQYDDDYYWRLLTHRGCQLRSVDGGVLTGLDLAC